MLVNVLYIVLILCGIVYIEEKTLLIERVINLLFREKDIPVEVMPGFTSSTSVDTEEILTREKMQEEIQFMNEYIFKNVDRDNGVVDIDLEDDDYVPLTPAEVA